MDVKICKNCKEVKPLSEFYFHKAKQWHDTRCRTCMRSIENARMIEWRKDNKEHHAEYRKERYSKMKEENPEFLKKKNAQQRALYYKNYNKERAHKNEYERMKRLDVQYRAERKAKMKVWKQRNLESYKAADIRKRHTRRARIKVSDFTIKELADVYKKAEEVGICPLCNKKTSHYELEHAIPLSRGGLNVKGNVYLCCSECNHGIGGKHTKTLKEFIGIEFKDLPSYCTF